MPFAAGPVLVLDTASPTVSVAVAAGGRLLAERREPIARSSVLLLPMIDEALAEAGATLGDLAGLVVLAGPGSFTGLRVGMATALGLHQAAGVPATAVPTFDALAAWARDQGLADRPLFAAVDVLRGEWAVQGFAPATADAAPSPAGEPERSAAGELLRRAAQAGGRIAGFGVGGLGTVGEAGTTRPAPGNRRTATTAAAPVVPAPDLLEPEALAPAAARELSLRPPAWAPSRLTEPLYFRPPAATLPR
jgi:tRNA threonylcarbamoyl adenosine modification protein YeaZ